MPVIPILLSGNWKILQDVHDTGEKLGLYNPGFDCQPIGPQLSEWEPLPRLAHLQLLYEEFPYGGRNLRFYNAAPWWYQNEFAVPEHSPGHAELVFEGVDYYCKIWLNGTFVGEHEGYSDRFSFDVTSLLKAGDNTLIVKVWSPFDSDVADGDHSEQTFNITRRMVKGTYEHSDTFIARDVNPVGIYAPVTLLLHDGLLIDGCLVRQTLSGNLDSAQLDVELSLRGTGTCRVACTVLRQDTGEAVAAGQAELILDGRSSVHLPISMGQITLWSTWDRGEASLYRLDVTAVCEKAEARHQTAFGLRKVELVRTPDATRFRLNGKDWFLRGTSYFPDVYLSAMHPDRYRRDLMLLRQAGFNAIRIHVHTENEILYRLCDEMGIAIIQDSEFNWMHPVEDAWEKLFTDIFLRNVRQLFNHASILCWICLNEPGVRDPMGTTTGRAMTISPGPAMRKALASIDPDRPVIVGSYCEDDPNSGDSHNYTGSLHGKHIPYTDIFGTTEKLNTEFGFDAPSCLASLNEFNIIQKRHHLTEEDIAQIQHYQYRLTKYYLEHYRTMKYAPCSGYIHFMLIDLGPNSFYGIYDWRGIPKQGLRAMLESNQPTGIFMKHKDTPGEIFFVSDLDQDLGEVLAEWTVTDPAGKAVCKGSKRIDAPADCLVPVAQLEFPFQPEVPYTVYLRASGQDGKLVAENRYEDPFRHPTRKGTLMDGHPAIISHESGMRLYHPEQ